MIHIPSVFSVWIGDLDLEMFSYAFLFVSGPGGEESLGSLCGIRRGGTMWQPWVLSRGSREVMWWNPQHPGMIKLDRGNIARGMMPKSYKTWENHQTQKWPGFASDWLFFKIGKCKSPFFRALLNILGDGDDEMSCFQWSWIANVQTLHFSEMDIVTVWLHSIWKLIQHDFNTFMYNSMVQTWFEHNNILINISETWKPFGTQQKYHLQSTQFCGLQHQMGVSKNRGTPKMDGLSWFQTLWTNGWFGGFSTYFWTYPNGSESSKPQLAY